MNLLKLVRNPKAQILFIGGCGGLYYYNNKYDLRGNSLISNYRQPNNPMVAGYNKNVIEKNAEIHKRNSDVIHKWNDQNENSNSANNGKTQIIAADNGKPKYKINVKYDKRAKTKIVKPKQSYNVTQKDIDSTMDCIKRSKLDSNVLESCVQNKFGANWSVSINDKSNISDSDNKYHKNGYMQFVLDNKKITIWNTQM